MSRREIKKGILQNEPKLWITFELVYANHTIFIQLLLGTSSNGLRSAYNPIGALNDTSI